MGCEPRPAHLSEIGTFIPPAGTGNNGEGVELLFPSASWDNLGRTGGGFRMQSPGSTLESRDSRDEGPGV